MDLLNKLLAIDLNYIIIGIIALFFTLEQFLGGQFTFKKRGQHFFQNFLFMVVFVLLNILWATVLIVCIEWLNNHEIGLFYSIELPVWAKLILGVVLFDFVTYWFHRMAHNVPLLWRFHRVHHSDTTMDSSTYFRGHPVEIFLWFSVSNIVAAGIFGLDLYSLGLYTLAVTPFLVIEHSNLRFPKWIDKTFGLIFTTPNIHKVHHEQDQQYTDSNYSDIFIVWDRLFGTFKHKPVEEIKFGLAEFDEEKKQGFWYLLISPFINMGRIGSDQLKK
ncbi:MAG: sterol desaturase family protein [Terrimonas sp.]|nr:sterol desaturase family protein [Terrimonas sp.]